MPLKRKKNKTIFRYFLAPMLLLVLLEMVLWEGCFSFSGLFQKLDQNAKDLLEQRVLNRSGYLQNEMIYGWSNLSELTEIINKKAEKLQEQGVIDFATLDESSEKAAPLLLEILYPMVRAMRAVRVTGIYVIFNNEDLDQGLEDKTGIYIRDADPLSQSSSVNADLLFERAPIQVIEESNISTDSMWRPRFEFKKRQEPYYDFFYQPFQAAYFNEQGYSASEMGYWGSAYTLSESSVPAITYSLPLINQDGMVYGVLGVDITLSYLNKLLPYGELSENKPASYLLAIKEDESQTLAPVFLRGNAYIQEKDQVELIQEGDNYLIAEGKRRYYTAVEYLDLYVSNTPYSHQKWLLAGIVEKKDLFSFTSGLKAISNAAMLILFLLGVLISLWASYLVSRPIRILAEQADASVIGKELLLKRTHILEIDKLVQKMEILDRSIRNTAMKFTHILKMSSVKMAGFEYNAATEELFLSDNFFEIFLDFDANPWKMTPAAFQKKMKEYEKCLVPGESGKQERLYEIPDGENTIYVRMRFVFRNQMYTGVVENVTGSVTEKRRIEYERDHDALTGLLNRRAFLRKTKQLLQEERSGLGAAGLLMVDLDNLKLTNDTYGHENGDRYIQKAAEVFQSCLSEHAVISRIAGDEFNIFLYGYEGKEELRMQLEMLERAIRKAKIRLPDGGMYQLRASGGFAWLSEEYVSLEEMQKNADCAMYQAKRSGKGQMKEYEETDEDERE